MNVWVVNKVRADGKSCIKVFSNPDIARESIDVTFMGVASHIEFLDEDDPVRSYHVYTDDRVALVTITRHDVYDKPKYL